MSLEKVQEHQVGLKLNGTHQLLTYANDVNLLESNNADILSASIVISLAYTAG
jgi:hypothetical protein